MADNTVLNEGSGGDTIRNAEKTVNDPAKTQLVIVDTGGAADDDDEIALVSTVKGTQGANPIPVQATKDGGRTPVVLTAQSVNGTTTTTLISCSINVGGTVTSGTSYSVPEGSVFRVQSITANIQSTGDSPVNVTVSLLSAASVGVTSPVFATLNPAVCKSSSTSSGFSGEYQTDTADLPIPDGLEFTGATEVALAQDGGNSNSTFSTSSYILSVCLIGYIY